MEEPHAGLSVSQCPFLHGLLSKQEEEGLDCQQSTKANQLAARSENGITNLYKHYHGSQGIVPLKSTKCDDGSRLKCPYFGGAGESQVSSSDINIAGSYSHSKSGFAHCQMSVTDTEHDNNYSELSVAPFGSIGLTSFNLFPDDFFNMFGKKKSTQQRKQNQSKKNVNQNQSRLQKGPGLSQSASRCPLRGMLGPFAPLVFKDMGKVHCPKAIVVMRAALAKTELIRTIRPQTVPVRAFCIAIISATANIPFGAARQHLEKFSPGWFAAVHASVPFVAMLRKAVALPTYAIAITIAGSVVGQIIGGKVEKARLKGIRRQSSMGGGKLPTRTSDSGEIETCRRRRQFSGDHEGTKSKCMVECPLRFKEVVSACLPLDVSPCN